MFKSLISLMIVFSLFTVQAQASTVEGLKQAFDELHFSLEHEWDQQDRTYYEAQMKKFNQELRNLQAQGLTSEQLLDFAKSQTKNPQMAKDLETAFTMIKINKMSSSDANRYILDVMKKTYSRGASWTGEVFIYAAIGILIVALAVGIATGSTSSGGGYTGGSNCYYDSIYLCDTYCYDDYWYGYTCYDDCYWSRQYMCY